jgi:hypothetical protein
MADMETEGRKTRGIGFLSKEKVKQELGKVWSDYLAASTNFAKAKTASTKAGNRRKLRVPLCRFLGPGGGHID